MEQSTLAEILGVEQDIRAQLEAERAQASRWLEDARRALEQAHQAELAQLQSETRRHRELALQAATEAAAAMVRRAEAAARVQADVSDEELRALLRRHLAGIVPEGAR